MVKRGEVGYWGLEYAFCRSVVEESGIDVLIRLGDIMVEEINRIAGWE